MTDVKHRRMRDPVFREEQKRDAMAAHVAPINKLVADLCEQGQGQGWVPQVAPFMGGVNAQMLQLFRDPGPKTNLDLGGSGFLCVENDDRSAERLATLLDEVGIAASETVGWNSYPWYINKQPNSVQLELGVEPLHRLIGLLPNVRVVMLMGLTAWSSWGRLIRRHPSDARGKTVISTYHTSAQAFIGTPEVKEARLKAQRAAFEEAARTIHPTRA